MTLLLAALASALAVDPPIALVPPAAPLWTLVPAPPPDPCPDRARLERRFARVPRDRDVGSGDLLRPACLDGDGRVETMVDRARRCLQRDPWDGGAAALVDALGDPRDADALVPLILAGSPLPSNTGRLAVDARRWFVCGLPPPPPARAPGPTLEAYARGAVPLPDASGSWRSDAGRALWRAYLSSAPEVDAAAAIAASQRVELADRPTLGALALRPWTPRGAAARALLARHPLTTVAPADVAVPLFASPTPPCDAASVRAWALERLAADPEGGDASRVGASLLRWVGRPEDIAVLGPLVRGPAGTAQGEAIAALARIGTAEAFAVVLDGLPSDEAARRVRTAFALAASRTALGWRLAAALDPAAVGSPPRPQHDPDPHDEAKADAALAVWKRGHLEPVPEGAALEALTARCLSRADLAHDAIRVLVRADPGAAERCVIANVANAAPSDVVGWAGAVRNVGTLDAWAALARRSADLEPTSAAVVVALLDDAGLDARGAPR